MPEGKYPGIDLPPRDRDGARRRAQNHFTAQAERDAAVKHEIAQERAVSDAKTAKLRALRLAKEEADREAAAAAPQPAAKAVKKRVRKINVV
jgi:hypothetical protein